MEEHSFKTKTFPYHGLLKVLFAGIDGQMDKFPNLLQYIIHLSSILIKSFFGKKMKEVSAGGKELKQEEAKISMKNKIIRMEHNAEAVAAETTYESGEGDVVIIPVPTQQTKTVSTGNQRRRGSGARTRTVVLDDTEFAMYGGK